MINVYLLGDELRAGNFKIHPIKLPTAPIVGDRFKVTGFTYDGTVESLSQYLINQNLSDIAEVKSRVWGKFDGDVALHVFLKFVELEATDEKPDGFFF